MADRAQQEYATPPPAFTAFTALTEAELAPLCALLRKLDPGAD
jgi:hypothetical protein